MRSGRLKHGVFLQENVEIPDPRSGQKVKEWETRHIVFAGIEPLRGRELYAAQQFNSEVTVRIVMRWHPDIAAVLDHSWSVLLSANSLTKQAAVRYQILHDPINPDMRNRELHLMCKVVS
ncbi:MAG: phage head closure protein [Thiolinea sp.]